MLAYSNTTPASHHIVLDACVPTVTFDRSGSLEGSLSDPLFVRLVPPSEQKAGAQCTPYNYLIAPYK